MNYPKYESYKDSGIDWLGEIPSDWKQQSNKYIFKLKKTLVGNHSSDYVLLSLTLKGIIERDMENPEGKFPAEFNTYQIVEKNDFVFCLFDVEETPRTVGLSEYNGMITGAYTVMEVSKHVSNKYFYYFYLNLDTDKRLKSLYTGLRNTISKDSFFSFKSFVPPIQEQTLIAKFLDQKTSQIDEAIRIEEKQIELLKEQKQIMIQNAVTKGLDPNVKMKDSGVDWIGEIPEHWEVTESRWLFSQRKDKAKASDVQLTASQKFGVIPQALFMELENRRVVQVMLNHEILKKVEQNDFVISMRSFQGGIELSRYAGSVSSAYIALIPNLTLIDIEYYKWLLKSDRYIEALQSTSNLVRDGQALRFENFKMVPLIIVPIEEQKKIAKYIDEYLVLMESNSLLLVKQIEKLKEYKTTLINSAVTGKIKVTPEMVGDA